ncbi:hypothetical protein [Photobacterium indicum]|uniref:hypothetical protein n=1 Tax=Photobacterium indicum TaxID=81447 RepID=UPI0014753A79|nr:hypothetical protein [Photobacterium indicum]
MFKIFPLIFICLGIYLGLNYNDEVETIMDTETFEKIQEKVEEGKDVLLERIEILKDK